MPLQRLTTATTRSRLRKWSPVQVAEWHWRHTASILPLSTRQSMPEGNGANSEGLTVRGAWVSQESRPVTSWLAIYPAADMWQAAQVGAR